jgi:hypothetical protein
MISDDLILLCHIMLFYSLALSPLITDCYLKKINLILIMFLCIQYVTKYGKCGLINIERYFLGDNFKNGIVYRLIKPVISYKNNIFYEYFFWLIIIYIFILYYQLSKSKKSLINIIQEYFYNKK